MTKNIGGIERILRAIVGLGLIAIVFVGPHTPRGLARTCAARRYARRLEPALRTPWHHHAEEMTSTDRSRC